MQGPHCLVCIRDDPLQSTLILPEIDPEEAHWSTSKERTMISVSHEHSQPIPASNEVKVRGQHPKRWSTMPMWTTRYTTEIDQLWRHKVGGLARLSMRRKCKHV